MLKIALPNKGRLAEETRALFDDAGLAVRASDERALIATLMESTARLIAAPAPRTPERERHLSELVAALSSVLRARGRRYLMANVPRSALDQVRRVLPGINGPTVVDILNGGDMVAVHAVVETATLYRTVADLKAQGADDAIDLAKTSPDHGRRVAAYYWWLYPNTMFNVYPWGVSINVVRPLGVALTRVSFLTYVWDAARLDQGAGAGLDRVEREDEVIVEAVQRGLKSPLYSHGRYSPAREGGVHHFHRMMAATLRG